MAGRLGGGLLAVGPSGPSPRSAPSSAPTPIRRHPLSLSPPGWGLPSLNRTRRPVHTSG